MLVLSRSKGDAVIIGDVMVEVVEFSGGRVRLGIKAPPELPVHRSEVSDAVARNSASPADQASSPSTKSERVSKTSQSGSDMLILSRAKNESIVIGNDITVVVVEIRKINDVWKARLGIEAPKEVPVHRKEVWDAIVRLQDKPSAEQKSNRSVP